MTEKFKHKKELIIGLVALVLSFLVIGGLALYLGLFVNHQEQGGSLWQPSTESTAPTLVANPYSAGDFGYKDGLLTCLSGQTMRGIDVSSHQKLIDWPLVASDGIEFAIIRLGYRGWGTGEIVSDELAQTNLQGAAEAGLKVGAYFYSQAISVAEAQEEARFVLEQLAGRQLDMPVVFDWEIFSESGRTALVDGQTLLDCTLAFCDIIEAAGYQPMIYFNLDVGTRLLDLVELQQRGYPFWLAMYTDSMTYPYRIEMWQYSETGKVKGIEKPVDMNLYFIYE